MENYKRFRQWVDLLALFTAVFVGDLILHALEHAKLPFLLSAAAIGLFVIATMHILELLVTTLFNRLDCVRRFILGDENIEGMWFDNVVGEGLYGLIAIHVRDGRITITGEQFDSSGNTTATWENYMVAPDGNTVRAIYRSSLYCGKEPTEMYGFTTYTFTGSPGEQPAFYSGFFADTSGESRKCQLCGFRVQDANVLHALMKPDSRRAAIQQLMRVWPSKTREHATPAATPSRVS